MNEEIIVYAFARKDGVEEEFTTIDKDVAADRARRRGLKVIERVYEYKYTKARKGRKNG